MEGIDAAYKLAILSTLAFRARVKDTDVHTEGITRLRTRDFLYAKELGYAIKLLALASKRDGAVQVRVHPAFVPQELMLAKVDGVLNAVEIETDLAGSVLFSGPVAGSMPTTSAVIADLVNIARNVVGNLVPPVPLELSEDVRVQPMEELETRYYLRLIVADRPGVLARIAQVLGDPHISIASVIQKEADEEARRAEIVLMTHEARESSVQQAIEILQGLDVVDGSLAKEVQRIGFETGLLIGPSGTGGRVIKLIPPLTIPDEDLAEGLDLLEAALRKAVSS